MCEKDIKVVKSLKIRKVITIVNAKIQESLIYILSDGCVSLSGIMSFNESVYIY